MHARALLTKLHDLQRPGYTSSTSLLHEAIYKVSSCDSTPQVEVYLLAFHHAHQLLLTDSVGILARNCVQWVLGKSPLPA